MANTPTQEADRPRSPLKWTDHVIGGAPADEAPPDDIAGRYVIQQLLGRGGMASVYLGRDRRLKRSIAIKILRRGIEVERFEREAVILADLRHDHIAEVHDSGLLADGRPYFITQYLDGVNLGRLLAVAPLPWEVVLAVGQQVAAALSAVHRRGVIHRDVKPENIMLLRPVGGELCVKLVDFGVARLTTRWDEVAQRDTPPKERRRTQEGLALGTDGYISLAASMGQLAPEADVFALGVTLFKLCTGQHPYEADLQAIAHARIAAALAQVILKAIDVDPAREISSADALGVALAEVGARQSPEVLDRERKAYLARVFFRDERPARSLGQAIAPDAATAVPPADPAVKRPNGAAPGPAPVAGPRGREDLRQWVGRVLCDRFELEGVLGDGGSAVVFDAWDMSFRQRAAIKVLLPELATDPLALQRFEHEGRVLMKVRQEHLLGAFDRGITPEGLRYLALEHLDGAHLGKIRGVAWLHWPVALEVGVQAAKALDALHRAGVLHRDVVPTNLVWTRDARRPVNIKLIDASHCKLLPGWYDRERRDGTRPRDRLVTREGLIFGDRRFRPPEAGLYAPHPREDIFGLGVTLYLLMTGKYPYPAGMPRPGEPSIDAIPLAEANPTAGVPPELAQLVHDAVHLDPARRPESAEEFFDQWMSVAESLDGNTFHDYVLTGGLKFSDCPEARETPDGAIRRPDWDRLRVAGRAVVRGEPKPARPVQPKPVRPIGSVPTPVSSTEARSQFVQPPPVAPEAATVVPFVGALQVVRDNLQEARPSVRRFDRPKVAVLSHAAVAVAAAVLVVLALRVSNPEDDRGGPAGLAQPQVWSAQAPQPSAPLRRPTQDVMPSSAPERSDTDRLRDALRAGCAGLHGSLRLSLRIEEHRPRVLRIDSMPIDIDSRPEHRCIQDSLAAVRLELPATATQLFVIKL